MSVSSTSVGVGGMLRKSGRVLLLIGAAIMLLWVQQADPGNVYSNWQTAVWNAYQRWGIKVAEHQQPMVFVVQIDSKSMEFVREKYGEDWPWPRQRYAELLEILFEQYKVGVVGVDIAMPDTRDREGNEALLALSRQYPVVLPQIFDFNPPGSAMKAGVLAGGVDPPASAAVATLPQAYGYAALNAQLSQTACVGHVNPVKDVPSGMVTRVPPLIRYDGRLYPMLALEMLRCKEQGQYAISFASTANGLAMLWQDLLGEGGAVNLPLDREGLWRVPYRLTREDIGSSAIVAQDVLQRKVLPDIANALPNSMVLLAGTAPLLGDQHPTPLEADAVGMTIHLQILQWLLRNYHELPAFSLDYWSWVAGFAGLALLYLLLMSGVGVGNVMLAPLLMALAWLGLGFWAWVTRQWFVPMHPVVLFLAFLVILVPLEWWLAQRTTGRLRKLFQDYLPAQLVGHIVNDNRNELLQPSKRCLTLLFADIANFTQRAERVSPEVLAELTQQILECLTAVAHQHQGTVDKYMGDAVMVFWNAPFPQPDHADRGVAAAVDMMAAIARFNAIGSNLLQGEPIEVRIGVHTGDVVVGDLGTRFRHAYTAIGDAVNVTARLQTLAREMREHLVVSQQTVGRLKKHWSFISRGNIFLKGRQESVGVYTLSSLP